MYGNQTVEDLIDNNVINEDPIVNNASEQYPRTISRFKEELLIVNHLLMKYHIITMH